MQLNYWSSLEKTEYKTQSIIQCLQIVLLSLLKSVTIIASNIAITILIIVVIVNTLNFCLNWFWVLLSVHLDDREKGLQMFLTYDRNKKLIFFIFKELHFRIHALIVAENMLILNGDRFSCFQVVNSEHIFIVTSCKNNRKIILFRRCILDRQDLINCTI